MDNAAFRQLNIFNAWRNSDPSISFLFAARSKRLLKLLKLLEKLGKWHTPRPAFSSLLSQQDFSVVTRTAEQWYPEGNPKPAIHRWLSAAEGRWWSTMINHTSPATQYLICMKTSNWQSRNSSCLLSLLKSPIFRRGNGLSSNLPAASATNSFLTWDKFHWRLEVKCIDQKKYQPGSFLSNTSF